MILIIGFVVVKVCDAEDGQVVYVKASHTAQKVAKAPKEAPESQNDILNTLPPSMRKNVLASMNRNREAFAKLAKL